MISILHVDLKIPAEVDKSEKKVEEEEVCDEIKVLSKKMRSHCVCIGEM